MYRCFDVKRTLVLLSLTVEEVGDRVRVGERRIGGPFRVFRSDVACEGTSRAHASARRSRQLKWRQ